MVVALAGPLQRRVRASRTASVFPLLLVAAILSCLALRSRICSFVGMAAGGVPQAPALHQHRSASATAASSSVARAAFSWDAEEPPELPETPDVMCKQAANAAMRAYRDGKIRQTIRLRLDGIFDMETAYQKGQRALLNATLPVAEDFARCLWGGEYLKQVRTSRVDEEVATLIYREADNEMQDMAALYLPGREFVSSNKAFSFFDNMKDRLVILLNPENAIDSFAIENRGRDFVQEGKGDTGAEICQMFGEQSYYHYKVTFDNWQLTYLRAYPFPWQVYIEDLNYTMVQVGESEDKPAYDQIIEWLEKYEQDNNIKVAQKVGKTLKDFQGMEEKSEAVDPGWRGR